MGKREQFKEAYSGKNAVLKFGKAFLKRSAYSVASFPVIALTIAGPQYLHLALN
jgi:hypothetical protein